jgi:hypothetical protein
LIGQDPSAFGSPAATSAGTSNNQQTGEGEVSPSFCMPYANAKFS